MLKRLFFGLGLLGLVILCFAISTETALVLIAVFACIACHEIGGALKQINRNVIEWVPMVFIVASTLMIYFKLDFVFVISLMMTMVIVTFAVCMKSKKRTAQDAIATLGIILYPGVPFTLIVHICSLPFPEWLVIFATGFVAGVGCDTFAYFGGKFFGKHKLAPVLSPKKTIEGSISGVVITMGFVVLFWYLGRDYVAYDLWKILVAAFLCTIISQLGDLSASYIKRETGIKDFGNLIPSHGGAMDRLDSVLFSVPAGYIILRVLEYF